MTEHSASIFVFFFLGEYSSLILMSAFMSIFFLGGYHCPNIHNIVLDPISDMYYFLSSLIKSKSEILENNVYNEFQRIYLELDAAMTVNKELLLFDAIDNEKLGMINENYMILLENRDYIYDCIDYAEEHVDFILTDLKLKNIDTVNNINLTLTLSNIKDVVDNIKQIMNDTDWDSIIFSLIRELFTYGINEGSYIIEYNSNDSRFLQSMNILIDRIYGSYIFGIKIVIVVFFFIWVRASFPRLRYDQLMSLCWKELLPLIFGYIIFSICIFSSFNLVPFGTGF